MQFCKNWGTIFQELWVPLFSLRFMFQGGPIWNIGKFVFNFGFIFSRWFVASRAFMFPRDIQMELGYWTESGDCDQDELHDVSVSKWICWWILFCSWCGGLLYLYCVCWSIAGWHVIGVGLLTFNLGDCGSNAKQCNCCGIVHMIKSSYYTGRGIEEAKTKMTAGRICCFFHYIDTV